MRAAAAALALLLVAPAQVWAQDTWTGLSDEDLLRLATEVRAGRDAEALAASQAVLIRELMGQVEEMETTIAELKKAEETRAVAVAVAEDRDKRRAENEAALLAIVAQYQALLAKQGEIADRQMKQIDSLQVQQRWMMILGPLGFIAGALFFGAL